MLTARRLAPDARIDGLLLRGRATPTPRQLAEVGVRVDSLGKTTGAQFVRAATGAGAGVGRDDTTGATAVGGGVVVGAGAGGSVDSGVIACDDALRS